MRMYYHSWDKARGKYIVGLATSPDGFRWAAAAGAAGCGSYCLQCKLLSMLRCWSGPITYVHLVLDSCETSGEHARMDAWCRASSCQGSHGATACTGHASGHIDHADAQPQHYLLHISSLGMHPPRPRITASPTAPLPAHRPLQVDQARAHLRGQCCARSLRQPWCIGVPGGQGRGHQAVPHVLRGCC